MWGKQKKLVSPQQNLQTKAYEAKVDAHNAKKDIPFWYKLAQAAGLGQAFPQKQKVLGMVSPAPMATPTPTITPTPTPAPKIYRNPKWDTWQKTNPKRYAEILSGTQIASKKHNVPQDLLMDIPGLETSGGTILNQQGGPAQGWYQFEPGQKYIPAGFDPYSATASADLAARQIKNRGLSKWGVPRQKALAIWGKYWGTVDNPNNQNGMLTDWYSKDELNRYLSPDWQF